MKIMRITFCLFLIAYLFGCSGDLTQTGGSATRSEAKVLTDDLQITTDPNDQTQPSVAYDTVNKRYLVVWTDYRNVNLSCSGTVCGTDIFAKLCTGSGTGTDTTMTCGSEFLISNITGSPVSGNQSQPKGAYDVQNKKYLVVWTDSRTAGYTQIFGQYVNPDETLNGNNTAITPHDTSGGPNNPQYLSQSEPSLVYNETTKKFDIAWLDSTDSDNVNTVTVQPAGCTNSEVITYIPLQFGADSNMVRTGEINGANPLTTASSIRDYTKLVFTKTSGFIVSGPTGPIAASFETQVDEAHPSIFYNKATGENFAAWQGRTNSVDFTQPFTPVAQTTTETQTANPPLHTLALCGGVTDHCWLAGDPVSVTFTHPLTTTPAYFLNDNAAVTNINLPPATAITGATVITGILTATSNAVPPTAAAGSSNNTSPIKVVGTLSLGNLCNYGVQTWTVTDKDAGIQRVKVRQPTGTSQTGTLFKDLSFGTSNSFNPAITTDPNTQRALLAWEESNAATGKDINGLLIDLTSFTPYSTQISVTNAQGDQTLPAVSFDNVNQRFLVVWEDARNQSANISNIDIFSQFVDPQGNLSGANSAVTVAPGNQLAPALTFGDVDFRKFLVVWADGRQPSNADIFGQLMEFSLSSQLLIADATGTPILTSAIDFGNVPIGVDTNNVPLTNNKTVAFKICNNGNTQLTIHSMTQPDAPFSITTPIPVTISPGVCSDMVAQFTPIAAGSFAGNSSNNFKTTIDSSGGKVTLYFSGSGTGDVTLRVTTPNLPDGDTLSNYNQPLLAFGGVFPFTWSVSAGTLPPGMTMDSASGRISGQPTSSGSFTFTVRVTDNNGNTATRQLTINVSVLTITNVNTTLKQWTVGQEYGNAPVEQITAVGGATPYSWSISGGNLPSGLSIDPSTGRILGVPGQSGQFQFTVKATESGGQIASKDFMIKINPPPSIQTASLPAGGVGRDYNQTLKVSGGTPAITWAITSGSLPPGLALDAATGAISGTATGASKNNFTVTTTDTAGASVSKDLSIDVTAAGAGGGSVSNSGGGCSIGRKQNGPTQAADALVMLAPLFAIIALRNLRRKKK